MHCSAFTRAARLSNGRSSRLFSNHLRLSTKASKFPVGTMRPQTSVIKSGPAVASEAIAGNPQAIASSNTNPKPSKNDGNTNRSAARYRNRSSSAEHGGRQLTPRGNDDRLFSANCQEPTSSNSESGNAAFSHASSKSGIPLRNEICPAYMSEGVPVLAFSEPLVSKNPSQRRTEPSLASCADGSCELSFQQSCWVSRQGRRVSSPDAFVPDARIDSTACRQRAASQHIVERALPEFVPTRHNSQ